jgi:lysophospholipase L1-like esterase
VTTTDAAPPTVATPATTVAVAEPDPDAPRFLALGDSYVIGQSVAEEERWPAQLARRLRGEGVSLASPEFIARTGWTTGALAQAIDREAPEGPYGLVGLQIGVNNQFNGGDLDVFRTEFAALLERCIALADGDPGRVLVLSIPNWGVTPFAPDGLLGRISYEVALFNEVVAEETAARGALFVDVTENSKKAGDDPAYLSFDELHPSGLMYAEWAELALTAVVESLSDR